MKRTPIFVKSVFIVLSLAVVTSLTHTAIAQLPLLPNQGVRIQAIQDGKHAADSDKENGILAPKTNLDCPIHNGIYCRAWTNGYNMEMDNLQTMTDHDRGYDDGINNAEIDGGLGHIGARQTCPMGPTHNGDYCTGYEAGYNDAIRNQTTDVQGSDVPDGHP